jgi:hypothetical protein
MALHGQGLVDDDSAESAEQAAPKIVYVIHPNCAVDDD